MVGALILLTVAVASGLYWSQTVTIKEIRFEGYHFLTEQNLVRQVDIPLGINPDSLNYMDIVKQVEQVRYVKYARISVDPDGSLLVEVTERQPIALLADGSDKVYVDEEGVKLPPVPGKAADVPLVYGFEASPVEDTLNTDAFRAVRDFLAEVRRNPVCDATISEVVWTGREGIMALSGSENVKLVFGKENFKPRLRNWEAFYAEVIPRKGLHNIQSVDLRFRGQIVTKES